MNAKYSQKSRQYILVLKKNVIIASLFTLRFFLRQESLLEPLYFCQQLLDWRALFFALLNHQAELFQVNSFFPLPPL